MGFFGSLRLRVFVLLLSGLTCLSSVSLFAQAQSSTTNSISILVYFMVIMSFALFSLVLGLLLFFAFRFREGSDVTRSPIQNEKVFEIGWTVATFVIIMILFFSSVPVILQINEGYDPAEAEYVVIVAEQFQWTITPPGGDESDTVVIAGNSEENILELKVGQKYILNITSKDVIHSFFVYKLSFKMDALPNHINQYFLEIVEPGRYQIVCAEFCGTGHYVMSGYILAS